MLSLVQSGKKIGIVDLTLGELSTRGNLKTRKVETDNATRLLGLSARENLKIPDGHIEINLINKKKVISVIRKYMPEIIFAPYPSDRHPDHVNAGNLIKECFFYSGLVKIKTKESNVHRAGKLYFYRGAKDIPVSFIYDTSKFFKKKLKLIECYATQFYSEQESGPETFISTKLFNKEIEARDRHFGFKIGAEYGEPFFSEEAFKVDSKTLFNI